MSSNIAAVSHWLEKPRSSLLKKTVNVFCLKVSRLFLDLISLIGLFGTMRAVTLYPKLQLARRTVKANARRPNIARRRMLGFKESLFVQRPETFFQGG